MSKKRVYLFGDGKAEGKTEMKNLLGGKGANLAEMTSLGLSIPHYLINPVISRTSRRMNKRYRKRK